MEAKEANAGECKARQGSTLDGKANLCSHYRNYDGAPSKKIEL